MTLRLPAAVRRSGIVCSLLLSACASREPAPAAPPLAPDAPFGAATRAVLAQQIANPDAASQTRNPAATGMDGRAASQAQGRYQKSYAEPPAQQSSFTIGVGSGK